ncbi:phosphoribosylaminoimidazolesuccinocarboxamide synthase [Guyparkeria hydrothermalis]|uniref:phosphoribosylaminoimidazolesuccinocarboxamide synthase n=1 Tax=Guyparkeria TaxID=2035712 RepID=UPI0010AC44B7|nr:MULTISPECIES: phosphoribosylaminoimidazolesuccinocarboxamide synthase [Guyparkeria]MCL7750871.1 phosphoribosylaminoimidazolesuccinocarboxamide synthase [Guyparkeria hydrothermalis]TKA90658.1 phosphoribosylaminoimidazolesuccinocarboxamide synthase [Guyparkeria sp. SB14A]
MTHSAPAVFETQIDALELIHRGKVRDLYRIDDERMLIVTTDRVSAFDVILPTPIPDKGRVLTEISRFWFEKSRDLVPNHLCEAQDLAAIVPDEAQRAQLVGRSVIVRNLKALPIEAVVRGYLIGSGYKDYQATGAVCGIKLPEGLQLADKLPEPIYTPATKADVGDHDENIDFAETERLIGPEMAAQVRDTAMRLYRLAADYAAKRGIIIADTKFEFGLDEHGTLHLIDEALTPDSSRFWPADEYRPGISPPSFDKQFIRDWLETLDWDKTAPGPAIPDEIIAQTRERYLTAYRRLTGEDLPGLA